MATACAVPVLRPYQEKAVAAIRDFYGRGVRRVCYQAPTGSGKTILFAYIVAAALARGSRIIILGHRDEIVRQISEALTALGVAHGFIAAQYDESDSSVLIASVATLVRRLDQTQPPDLIVIDECHHAVAGSWRKILAAWPQAKALGVTATPERLDGKGLEDIFETLVLGPTIAELIEQQFLAPFTVFAPANAPDLSGIRTRAGDFAVDQLAGAMSREVVIGGAVDEYARICPGVPAIAFCVDIMHSKMVAERFAANGYRAAHVDGTTAADERRAMIAGLGNGNVQVLCNCGLISEGLDVPAVVADILLRPTKSRTLYMQQVGRALRPMPGKGKALILDHSGNTFRFGPVDAPRDWSLKGQPPTDKPPPLCRCPECAALNPAAALHCENCGALLREPAPPRPLHEIHTGQLVEIDRLSAMSYGQVLRWAGADVHKLRLVQQARGYKPGWVFKVLQERAAS